MGCCFGHAASSHHCLQQPQVAELQSLQNAFDVTHDCRPITKLYKEVTNENWKAYSVWYTRGPAHGNRECSRRAFEEWLSWDE